MVITCMRLLHVLLLFFGFIFVTVSHPSESGRVTAATGTCDWKVSIHFCIESASATCTFDLSFLLRLYAAQRCQVGFI